MGNTFIVPLQHQHAAVSCTIKYITPPLTLGLHDIQDYEYARSRIQHRSYDELKAQVLAHCPPGFQCVVPIARRHELIWRMHHEEEDCLLQPIFKVHALVCIFVPLNNGNNDRRNTTLWTGPKSRVYASI